MHDCYSFVFLSDLLIWPTRLVFLTIGEVFSFGFNLAVSFPSDSRGHETYVSLLIRVKILGLFMHEFTFYTSCHLA